MERIHQTGGKDIIIKMRIEENAGLGRIFRYLRSLSALEAYGDYILYKRVLITLRLNGYPIPIRSITQHFKSISPEDYLIEEKDDLLVDLRKTQREVSKGGQNAL